MADRAFDDLFRTTPCKRIPVATVAVVVHDQATGFGDFAFQSDGIAAGTYADGVAEDLRIPQKGLPFDAAIEDPFADAVLDDGRFVAGVGGTAENAIVTAGEDIAGLFAFAVHDLAVFETGILHTQHNAANR